MEHSVVVYDCEIVRMIPVRGQPQKEGLEYCGGWGDHEGMGISVIGAYDYLTGQLKAYVAPEVLEYEPWLGTFSEFQTLVDGRRYVVGFNSKRFDDKLCAAHNINVKTNYDLLEEARLATGQPANYVRGKTRAGYNLGALAQANLGVGKSGSGELAPELWQQGEYYQVVRYCLDDVMLTKQLLDRRGDLVDPTDGQRFALRDLENNHG